MGREDRRRNRQKGRGDGGYLGIPHYILRSQEFGGLDGWGVKLLIELAGNYNGKNNGDLSAAFSVLRKRGWRSAGTLAAAIKQLVDRGWLMVTRHGGRNCCALYAVSWWAIDNCDGKRLEVKPEPAPRHSWKKTESLPAIRSNVPAIRSSQLSGDGS